MSQITALQATDQQRWADLFTQYCEFYGFDCTDQKKATVWEWLMDGENSFTALAARNAEGKLVGFAHYQTMPLSLFGTDTGYLADLFVDPAHRRQGIAEQLHQAFTDAGKEKGWPFAAWLTQEGNTAARAMYDKTADMTDLRYYVEQLG